MGTVMTIWNLELDRYAWDQLREANGKANTVPGALRRMLTASTSEEVRKAYWELENHVVVQGQLFEVAQFVVPVLLAALLDDSPPHVRISVLELLYQIVAGESHEDEVDSELGRKCRASAREGMWTLYKELHTYSAGHREAAAEVLQLIDPDSQRLAYTLAKLAGR